MPKPLNLILLLILTVLLSSAAAPQPTLLIAPYRAGPVGPPSFGLNTHLATRYPDPSSMDVPAETVVELGIEWAREDFHWHRVQPRPDVWNFTFTDAAMRALLTRGISVLGVLGPSVGWATPFGGDAPDDVSYYAPDPELFLEYVRGVVTRYRRYVHHWEIWNEPDNGNFWRPQPDPGAYARLLIRASALIKQIDPGAQVLIGGFNPFDTTFIRAVADHGGWVSFDIIAIHPYIDPYGPEDGNLAAAADAVRALAARLGPKPIWVTEFGWASGPGDRDAAGLTDEQEQASYLARALILLWQAGVERSFWYSFKDDPHNPYGLIGLGAGRTDYTPRKPAFAALRTLSRELAGATFVERRNLFTPQILIDFEQVAGWRRPTQPNGALRGGREQVRGGHCSAQISYSFTTLQNDYLVFERERPLPLGGTPFALGVWVYGDGSGQGVKVWLRDAEGELLQFVLGAVGPPGWHFISAPIGGPVEPGNQIEGGGNGRLDFPASLAALVLDDITDGYTGSGTIYLDDLTQINGREAYNLRFQRGDASLDLLWSPPGVRVAIDTRASQGRLIDRDGHETWISASGGYLPVDLGPAPGYLWHRR